MNKKFFFVCAASLILAACSEQVESENSEREVNDTQLVEKDSNEVQSAETEQLIVEEEEVNTKQVADDEEQSSEEKSITVKPNVENADKNIDYYEYYSTKAVAKDEDGSADTKSETSEQSPIVYEQLSEDVIQLPLMKDNENHFTKANIETISLAQLEEIKAVNYYEESLTRGYLIDINLTVLKDHYAGSSYSFDYNEEEYGVMISEDDKDYGFIYLKDVEGMLEDIKKNGTFNILN